MPGFGPMPLLRKEGTHMGPEYRVVIRRGLPKDIRQRISALHAAVILSKAGPHKENKTLVERPPP